LGCRRTAKVSRYERLARRLSLDTAFAYEVLFRTPARELFAGVFRGVEDKAVERARLLGARTKHQIAHAIANQFPELAPHVPPHRKCWMSEDYRMSIVSFRQACMTPIGGSC